jgi:hypothetical protein
VTVDSGRYLRRVSRPKPLFVIGIARGGTTLLARILDSASGVNVASDPFLPLYRLMRTAFVRDAGLHSEPAAPLDDYYFSDERIAALDAVQRGSLDSAVSPEELDAVRATLAARARMEAPDLVPWLEAIEGSTVRELFDAALTAVAESTGATDYAATKEVWTAEFVGPLARAYPEARFIVIFRDPRAVLASLQALAASDGTQAGHPLSYARHWRKAVAFVEHFRADAEIAPRVYALRYEDLVLSPSDELGSLCEFLEIPFEEQMTAPSWTGNSSYGQELSGIDPAPLERWRDQLDPGTLAMCELACGPDMGLHGYETLTAEPDGDAALAHLVDSDGWQVSWRSDLGDPALDHEREIERRSLLAAAGADTAQLRRAFLFEQMRAALGTEKRWTEPASTH